jgi:Prokaryotic N-terminal methylation motif
MHGSNKAFSLLEMLVAIAILILLVLFVTRLFYSAATLIGFRSKRMDTDGQVRPFFDRLAVDLAQMVRRSDVDYYLKSPENPQMQDPLINPTGNDQMAFYAMVPGYNPVNDTPSPASLVAYRIDSQFNLQRMGKGLSWNGVSSNDPPLLFLPKTIAGSWVAATTDEPEPDYELVAPNVFRFEYYYLLKNGELSNTPWDASVGHNTVSGLRDVVGIFVGIATIDTKSRVLASDTDLTNLAARMNDFTPSLGPEALLAQWQAVLNNGTNDMVRSAIHGIRIYRRCFQLGSTLP